MTPPGIQFTKMHGIGNDFVVIETLNQKINIQQSSIKQLAHRHTGIGFDQLLIIEPSSKADFFCRIYNSDGSEAEQCGNGLRCVARFLQENGIIKSTSFTLETKAGIFPVEIKDYDHIRVNLGVPKVKASAVRVSLPHLSRTENLVVLSLGNPHAILQSADESEMSAQQVLVLGKAISTHELFPQGINVGFMRVVSSEHIRLRTYERGAGETLACGSNACAAAIVGMINAGLLSKVEVEFSQGSLWVEWQGEGQPVYLTGPAATVFSAHT